MSVDQEIRFERKFVLDGAPPHVAALAVQGHAALFFEEFPPRTVNSLYLDSPGLRRYYEHCAGSPRRAKIRLRWYAELFGPVHAPQLEIKRREGLASIKHRRDAPSFTFDETFDGRGVLAGLRGAPLPAVFLAELSDVEPALTVSFRRRIFRSADRRIRLTIDSALEFHPYDRVNTPRPARAAAPGLQIVELKYHLADAADAADVAAGFPFRLGKMSKYCLGVRLVHSL